MIITGYGFLVGIAVLMAVLEMAREHGQNAALRLALPAIPLGFVFARLLYVIFRLPFFLDFGLIHAFNVRAGGFLLYGALLGVLLAACLVSRKAGTFKKTLDDLTCPGLLAIAICRFAEGTVGEGLGNWVEPGLDFFPLATPNPFGEYQWSIYLLEGICALILFICLLRPRSGRFLITLTVYAGCQIIFESLRMDSVLKIGFVRVSQLLSAVCLLILALIQRGRGGNVKQAAIGGGIIILLSLGVAGLEWALEKTQVSNLLIYAVMIVLSLCMMVTVLGIRPGQKMKQ